MQTEHFKVLYAHYEQSFSLIRERERQRDRLLYVFLGILGLATALVFYLNAVTLALNSVTVAGVRANLAAIPAPALLTATWVFLFLISLRYCQVSITVERQYDYLHEVEQELATAAVSERMFKRESAAYLKNFPVFSDWAWTCYIFIIPLIACSAMGFLLYLEWLAFPGGWRFRLADSILATASAANFALYRLVPLFDSRRL